MAHDRLRQETVGSRRADMQAAARPRNRHFHDVERELGLLIVSADDTTRSALQNGANGCRPFGATRVMADARFALEHLWDCIHDETKCLPDLVIADLAMHGLTAPQFVREIRRYDEMQSVFVAVYGPTANPREQDDLETAGCDLVIRGADVLMQLPRLFRSLAYRSIARSDPPELNALNFSCGSTGGCGLEVLAFE